MTEHERNIKRYENLSDTKKELLNAFSIKEFLKPIQDRKKAVELIDMIEF